MKSIENMLRRSIQLAYQELIDDKNLIGDKFHWTFIFYKNQYIVHGRNQVRKTHPSIKGHGYLFDTLHSEISAFLKLPYGIKYCKCTVVNVRLSKQSLRAGYPITKMAKPCTCCHKWLTGQKFKQIVYTKDNNEYFIESITN
jgi:hypothetical protein